MLFQWESRVQKNRGGVVPSWHPDNRTELFWVPIRNRIRGKLEGTFLFAENEVEAEIQNL